MFTIRPRYRAASITPLLSLCALLGIAACHGGAAPAGAPATAPEHATSFIRVNQIGYLPAGRKVAVVCSLAPATLDSFEVVDAAGKRAFGPARAAKSGPFGPCKETYRLDFSSLASAGTYRVAAAGTTSRPFRIAADVYAGAADTLLYYMREQRSGYNPLFRDSVHVRDGIIVDDPVRGGQYIQVSGGWADASDYLQYVTTSAAATFQMLMAYRENPNAFGDEFADNGLPGANGIPDVLDEARHGLEWLFGVNPWGVSMVVGLPAGGVAARDPHSVVADKLGVDKLTGGLLDGPVYRSIYQNLKGISLHSPDEYAPFNTGFIVYHDDIGDYSTNEPIMDGTANLTYLLGAMGTGGEGEGEQKAGGGELPRR